MTEPLQFLNEHKDALYDLYGWHFLIQTGREFFGLISDAAGLMTAVVECTAEFWAEAARSQY